jgi:hypothetical protein
MWKGFVSISLEFIVFSMRDGGEKSNSVHSAKGKILLISTCIFQYSFHYFCWFVLELVSVMLVVPN